MILFLKKIYRMQDGWKYARGKEFQRDAVRGIKLLEGSLFYHGSTSSTKQ